MIFYLTGPSTWYSHHLRSTFPKINLHDHYPKPRYLNPNPKYLIIGSFGPNFGFLGALRLRLRNLEKTMGYLAGNSFWAQKDPIVTLNPKLQGSKGPKSKAFYKGSARV